MTNRTLTLWLRCCLAVFLGTPGCSGDTDTGDRGATGSLSLSLELANGAEIDEVLYRIIAERMEPMNGAIDTSAPGATASVEVFGLPPGPGYVVELRADADDGTSCEGSAPFTVSAGETTSVMVMLSCKPPQRFGSVRVNGELNVCAHLEKVVVAPLQTSVGSSIDLSAQGADAEDDDVDYRWFASGGSISNPSGPISQYTCEDAGPYVIRAEVSDDGFGDCIDAWTVEVRCVGGEGACTDAENAAVYDGLEYLDGNGTTHTGTDAASAIASDCVFGSPNSEPINPGCAQKAQAVLICAIQGCPPETIQALADCLQACTQDLIEEVTGDQLSEDCADCYGESVACSAAFCATSGCSNPSSVSCIQCRCDEGCTPDFDVCSGIPRSGDCNETD